MIQEIYKFPKPETREIHGWAPLIVDAAVRYNNMWWFRVHPASAGEELWVAEVPGLTAFPAPKAKVKTTRSTDINAARTAAMDEAVDDAVQRLQERIANVEKEVGGLRSQLTTIKAVTPGVSPS